MINGNQYYRHKKESDREKIKDNPAMYLRTQKTEKNLTQFVREDDIVKLMEKPVNMNIIDIKIIPKKKTTVNKMFLII